MGEQLERKKPPLDPNGGFLINIYPNNPYSELIHFASFSTSGLGTCVMAIIGG